MAERLSTERGFPVIFQGLLSLALLFFFCRPVLAAEAPVEEKRSCIQSVDGFSYIAEEKTVGELRTAALNNAKQQALTNAKTYIRSRTEVENFVLKSDDVLIDAEGTVTILELKDHGIVDNSRYHVWIKAEVEYRLGEGSAPAGPAADPAAPPPESRTETSSPAPLPQAAAPLTVRIWSPKTAYRAGEKIEIFLQGNRDFYARIVDINGQGEIVQLLPNDYRTSSFFHGGRTYKIPDREDRFELTASPPFGKDRIVVYASEVPLGEVAMQSIGQGLSAFAGDQQTLAVSTRGISVTAKDSGEAAPSIAMFYEAAYEITTSK